MTTQVRNPAHGKSKATLLAALNDGSAKFYDPSPFTTRNYFGATDIKPGERFPVVMDPATRRRFATVERKPDGTFKVS